VELSQVTIVLTIVAFFLYAMRVRSIVWDRVVLLALAGGGIVLALQPDLATDVANAIGIGRGTDLLVYVFVLFSLFHIVHIGSRLRRMERQITKLARASALERSTPPGRGERGVGDSSRGHVAGRSADR
jgi:hypothetical protein